MSSMYLQWFCWHHSVIYFCCLYNVEKCTGLILVINTVVWQHAHFCYYSNNEQSRLLLCRYCIAMQCNCNTLMVLAIATPWWYLQFQHLDGTCNCNTLMVLAIATPWWYLQLQHLDGTCNCNTLNSCATATSVHNNCVHSSNTSSPEICRNCHCSGFSSHQVPELAFNIFFWGSSPVSLTTKTAKITRL